MPDSIALRMKYAWNAAAPYVAEFGGAAFAAVMAVTVAVAAAEFFSPGLAAHVIAPQGLAAAALVAGVLALAVPERPRRSRGRRAAYALVSAAIAAAAGWIAWRYFATVPERSWLAALAGGTAAFVFVALGGDGPRKRE
jgi:hypothetical protein